MECFAALQSGCALLFPQFDNNSLRVSNILIYPNLVFTCNGSLELLLHTSTLMLLVVFAGADTNARGY